MYTNAGSQCHSQIFSELHCNDSLTAKYGHAAQWPRIRFDANTPKARTIHRVELINSRDEHMEDADHHSATGRSSSNIMVDSHLCSRDVLPLSA